VLEPDDTWDSDTALPGCPLAAGRVYLNDPGEPGTATRGLPKLNAFCQSGQAFAKSHWAVVSISARRHLPLSPPTNPFKEVGRA